MESLRNPYKINTNWFGEFLAHFPMESLRNSFQNQWKLVWRALRQFPNGILMEFLSISMEIGLESSSSISQWNPYGIPFNINWNLYGKNPYGIPFDINGNLFGEKSLLLFLSNSMEIGLAGELLINFPMEYSRNSFQNQRKLVWRESLWNSFQNQWKLVWRALGQFPNGILKEFS